MQGCFGWKDGRIDAEMERNEGVKESRVFGPTSEYSFPLPSLSAAHLHLSRAGTSRDGPGGSREDGSGRTSSLRNNPSGTSPVSIPLSFLSAMRDTAFPINFIFLIICSPFRKKRFNRPLPSTDQDISCLSPPRGWVLAAGDVPPGQDKPRGAAGVGATLTAGELCH